MSDRSAGAALMWELKEPGAALVVLRNLCCNPAGCDYEKFCDACTKCQTELFGKSREANMNQRNDEELKRLAWWLKELVPEDRSGLFDEVCEKLLGVGWDCP